MTTVLSYFTLLISIYENQVESRLHDFAALYQSYLDEHEQFKELQSATALSSSGREGGLAPLDRSDFYLELLSSLERKRQSLALAQRHFYPIAESISRLLEDHRKCMIQASYANYSFKTASLPEFRLAPTFMALASKLRCHVKAIHAFQIDTAPLPSLLPLPQLASEFLEFKKIVSWLTLLSSPLV